MAGYSGTPLPKKLGIREGSRVALVEAPDGFEQQLTPFPSEVIFLVRAKAPLDVVVLFARDRATLDKKFGPLAAKLASDGGIWVAWPKKASGVPTDLTEAAVREAGLALGLVDNKVCAIDAIWSGLRFVIPVALRR